MSGVCIAEALQAILNECLQLSAAFTLNRDECTVRIPFLLQCHAPEAIFNEARDCM